MGDKTYKLQLISPDTRGNPQEALIQLKRMVEQDNARYVFGPFLTNVFNGIQPYVSQNNGKFLLMGGALGCAGRAYVLDSGKVVLEGAAGDLERWRWEIPSPPWSPPR